MIPLLEEIAMKNPFQKAMLISSIVYIVLGLLLVLWPDQARLAVCYLLGAAALLYGAYRIVDYFVRRQNKQKAASSSASRWALRLWCWDCFCCSRQTPSWRCSRRSSALRSLSTASCGCRSRSTSAVSAEAAGFAVYHGDPDAGLRHHPCLFNPFGAVKVATVVCGRLPDRRGAFTLWSLLKAKSVKQQRTVVLK